ncbi:MAG: trehalose-phosphatase [Candidatus Thermoplasmatota archaeon]|nr:trehalose-phosphatase [Candidatus Thermoplasmatota archaeon]
MGIPEELKETEIKKNVEIKDCAIFDMDGVITDTATIHAEAWKETLEPFGFEDKDYYLYIDGKPRYEGVESFLRSKNISLPYGNPANDLSQNTVCGIGNRKNARFLEKLEDGVRTFPTTIAFIKELKRMGVKVAAVSASRNCRKILEKAGVIELFDVVVSGDEAPGKREIFLEAAKRLGCLPERCAVVEDSLAGIEAAKGFKPVIGIDRTGKGLMDADVVVKDLSELSILKKPEPALENMGAIFAHLRRGIPAVFLDYDGTLTPIVESPEEATLSESMRMILKALSTRCRIGIISGRELKDVKRMVGVEGICYAGSHGLEMECDGLNKAIEQPDLKDIEAELKRTLGSVKGILFERKRFSIAVHYRMVDKDAGKVKKGVKEVARNHPELKLSSGKKVLELMPRVDWDKGKALRGFIEKLWINGSKVVPIYIGDDRTDEDAFRAIKGWGISILVGSRKTAADYTLKDTSEVEIFLKALLDDFEEDTWVLRYNGFVPEEEKTREALCTLGNGYFGTRGASPGNDVHYPGTYIAGCYNRLKSRVDGKTIENESMVNAPNWLPLTFRIGDKWFDERLFDILDYREELDMRRGVLTRFIRFKDDQNRFTALTEKRLVHMANPHLAALELKLVAENWSGEVELRASLDGRVKNSGVARYQQLNNAHLKPVKSRSHGEIISLQVETNQSHIRIAEAARIRITRDGKPVDVRRKAEKARGSVSQSFSVNIGQGESICVEKIVSLFTSRDRAVAESMMAAEKEVRAAKDFQTLLERHVLAWEHLWRRCNLEVVNNKRTMQILHLHIFHLLQTMSVHSIDMDVGVPPRGLHGEAYRGLIMWDELFIFPFINLRIPDITRALLMYRYRRLPEARRSARNAGHKGAMYPWQSGSDGREESQRIHLNPLSGRWRDDNTWLQKHINIAIAYNIWQYYQVTGDLHFLSYYGAEMLVEISRFWASIAKNIHGRYEIHGIMGPDEFHDRYPGAEQPGIDNNAYTNVMVAWTLCRTLDALKLLSEERREALEEDLGITREEKELWENMSYQMKIPFHGDEIISQFDRYGTLEEFDWDLYKKKYGNLQRLDRILEAEGDTTNRYKLSKQADVLMLFYLLSEDELKNMFNRLGYQLNREIICKNIDYYMKRTSHGSTLSRIVHSWVLAKYNKERSWQLFREALESDISDIQGGTTSEGVHLGAMGGTVDLMQRGYTGMETRGEMLWFDPNLPEGLKMLEFNLLYRQHNLRVHIDKENLIISASPSNAAPIGVVFKGAVVDLGPGETRSFPLSQWSKSLF